MPSDLDFISRPNPVEPSAHGNGNLSSHQLDRSTNEHLMPFLLNTRTSSQRRDASLETTKPNRYPNQTAGLPISNVLNKDDCTERTPPRTDQTFYTLPKLPVKRGTKRHRVPPVLQGLHEPPPTARILPSISAEETQVLLPSTRDSRAHPVDVSTSEKDIAHLLTAECVTPEREPGDRKPADKRAIQRNKWTDQETDDLLRGVAKFGIGSWKKILMCAEYSFNKRTAVDLKDRFRVCKPNAYGNPRTKKAQKAQEAKAAIIAAQKPVTNTVDTVNQEANSATTKAVGESTSDAPQGPESRADADADAALWKVRRRKRRKFTEEEDEALLRGYDEHGASWQAIQKDTVFQVTGRTPTDLRDRFRTRYPDHYAQSGLVPRPTHFPKPLPRSAAASEDNLIEENTSDKSATIVPESSKPPEAVIPSWQGPGAPSLAHRHHVLPLPRIIDDYLPEIGLLDDDDEGDKPIVLDRSIVDWAYNTMPSNRSVQHTEGAMLPGIDPLITLNLPKPGLY